MSYWDIAQMSSDLDLTARVSACAAQEGKGGADPRDWASSRMLLLAGSPGWEESWASAVAGENPHPGVDPAVITDGMILSSVQPLT